MLNTINLNYHTNSHGVTSTGTGNKIDLIIEPNEKQKTSLRIEITDSKGAIHTVSAQLQNSRVYYTIPNAYWESVGAMKVRLLSTELNSSYVYFDIPSVFAVGYNAITKMNGTNFLINAVIPPSYNGEKGDKGDKGDKGERGDKGDKGDKGDQGIQGIHGIQGIQGGKGDKGDKGDQGTQGITGAQGINGEKGNKGDKGEKGDKGDYELKLVGLNLLNDTQFEYPINDSIHWQVNRANFTKVAKREIYMSNINGQTNSVLYNRGSLNGAHLIKDKEYILIFLAKCENYTGKADFKIDGGSFNQTIGSLNTISTTYTEYSMIFKPTVTGDSGQINFYWYPSVGEQSNASKLFLKDIRLYDGKEITPWSLSQDDIVEMQTNIKVGGRNLIKNNDAIALSGSDNPEYSKRELGKITILTASGAVSKNAYNWIPQFLTETPVNLTDTIGNEYAFSVDVKCTGMNDLSSLYFVIDFRSPVQSSSKVYLKKEQCEGKWFRMRGSLLKTITTDCSGSSIIVCYFANFPVGATIEYRNFKFERGNCSTDYTVAPEDTENEITSLSTTVEQHASNLQSLNNMEIGGRNLLLKSGQPVTTSAYTTNRYSLGDLKPEEGDICTITLKGSLGSGKQFFGIYNTQGYINMVSIYPGDFKDGLATKTFNWKIFHSQYPSPNTHVNIVAIPSTVTVDSTIDWVRLDFGNKAPLIWTPAPEDIDADIISASKISDKLSNVGNPNRNTESGVFYMQGTDGSLFPSADWYHNFRMQHPGYPNGYWVDLASHFHGGGIYWRRNNNGSISGWEHLTNDSACPTIDYSSSWMCLRFPSGFMIQIATFNANPTITERSGTLYYGRFPAITNFPYTFVGFVPVVNWSVIKQYAEIFAAPSTPSSTTNAFGGKEIYVSTGGAYGQTSSIYLHVQAMGRWK